MLVKVRLRAPVIVAAAVVLLLAVTTGQASAFSAGTGQIYEFTKTMNNGVSIDACEETTVSTVSSSVMATGKAWSHVDDFYGGDCVSSGQSLPSGYIGTSTWLFRNGSVCNSGGSTSGSSTWSVAFSVTCSNLSGTQDWYSWGQGRFYQGQYCVYPCDTGSGYVYGQVRISPVQYG